jgi:hypothetical protein
LFLPAPGGPVKVGIGSGTLLFADLDSDGDADMLSRHLQQNRIAVLLGDEHGRFSESTAMTLSYAPGDMKLADFNMDGKLDLAVTPGNRDVVEVLFGDGRAGFGTIGRSVFVVSDQVDELNKRTMQVIDLDEDGRLDLATSNGRRRNTLGVLFGDGRGAFRRGPGVGLESGRDRYWYAFADVDADGHVDVVTASSGLDAVGAPGRLLVQLGNGRGGFTPVSEPIPIAAGPGGVAIADVNRDGRLDAIIAHNSGEVSAVLNVGRGKFAADTERRLNLGSRGYGLVADDVNGDAYPDLVAATVDSITVMLGTPSGFTRAPGSPYAAGPGAYSVSIADLNKDGKPDLAASSFEGDAVTVLLQR